MKIAFMGTPALAVPCLDALALDHEIAVVVTQPDKMGGRRNHELIVPPVKTHALELQAAVLQPERARNEEFVEQLRAFAPDAIAVVAYGQILPRSVLELAPRGCINLHFSLLPTLARRSASAIRNLAGRYHHRRHHAMDGPKTRRGRHHPTS